MHIIDKYAFFVCVLKVFFDFACMSTCCWGLPKLKYEPFITLNGGTLQYLVLLWQLGLFSICWLWLEDSVFRKAEMFITTRASSIICLYLSLIYLFLSWGIYSSTKKKKSKTTGMFFFFFHWTQKTGWAECSCCSFSTKFYKKQH